MIERRPPAPFPFPKPASNDALDVADRFTNGRELLRINIGNFDAEFLLKRELKLNQIYGVGTEVFRKARRHSYQASRRVARAQPSLLDQRPLSLPSAPALPPGDNANTTRFPCSRA